MKSVFTQVYARNIVTNPPYGFGLGDKFVRQAPLRFAEETGQQQPDRAQIDGMVFLPTFKSRRGLGLILSRRLRTAKPNTDFSADTGG